MERVPELRHEKGNVLVEGIENDLADSLVAPGTMHEQQLAEETELTNGNIGTSSSLQTFHAADTDTDVSSLDHRHIVCTVSNGQENGLQMTLDKLDDESFL